jgi:hypothetical protein
MAGRCTSPAMNQLRLMILPTSTTPITVLRNRQPKCEQFLDVYVPFDMCSLFPTGFTFPISSPLYPRTLQFRPTSSTNTWSAGKLVSSNGLTDSTLSPAMASYIARASGSDRVCAQQEVADQGRGGGSRRGKVRRGGHGRHDRVCQCQHTT